MGGLQESGAGEGLGSAGASLSLNESNPKRKW
jgi:hypothetical protein